MLRVYLNHFFENRFMKYGKIREILYWDNIKFLMWQPIFFLGLLEHELQFFSIFNYESSIL